jgi:hypothetical protein
MPSPYLPSVRAQVLDGKRTWSKAELGADADANDFFTQIVIPLRELKHEGVIDALAEVEVAIDGNLEITFVEIIGGINYYPEEAEES